MLKKYFDTIHEVISFNMGVFLGKNQKSKSLPLLK